ncbi:ssu-2 homolog, tandem duplicate 2 [Anguilla rostrata]|uniref:ssu-2 homolog, tandem duplicate 2 n=1 Tax=Anguilla rostrata TaxID=7938 RepID=UPI0030D47BD2
MDRRHLLSDQDENPAPQYQSVPSSGPVDPNQPEAGGATAPPADLMDKVPGYEGIGIGGYDLPYQGPPQAPGPGSPGPPVGDWRIPSISEEVAKEAFLEYAASKCCYSKGPAKEMVFTDLQAHNTYRYRLETFTESRSTKWASEPYTGQIVDGYMGVPPGPWDIAVSFPTLFQDNKKEVRVPHTSSVKGCHSCMSLGRNPCRKCVTSGMMQCWVCNGSGRRFSDDRCSHCNGLGRVRCTSCAGVGSSTCGTCQGKGQLLCFIKLVVKWKNNVFEGVIDRQSGLPMDRISSVTGETMFTDMSPVVYPVTGFPDNAINQSADRAVKEHQAQYFSSCRILQQRQTIELIHVTRVHYSWKEKTHIYFVYGAEHKVYTDDYPAKCCCCSIL